ARPYQGLTQRLRSPVLGLPAPNARRANLFPTDTSNRKEQAMTRIAAIIGGVLILAGAAVAGTVSSLGSSNGPETQFSPAATTTTVGQDDRGREAEDRGRENEQRGRENEAGED